MFEAVGKSRWRQRHLLILCYHGVSLEDEHVWRPNLYMNPETLEQRFRILKEGGYNVLPLGDALQHMYAQNLPPRSVAITFDDGTYDFYKKAYPILKSFGFPATVYQSTYYSDHTFPVFNLIAGYMLWKKGGIIPNRGRELGLDVPMDLRTDASQRAVVAALVSKADKEQLNGRGKDDLARQLATFLGIDYDRLLEKRILQLMNPEEISELSAKGVDFQLHTHRHRTPEDGELFLKEIQDNRGSLQRITGTMPAHFCYPSGVYRQQFLPWLEAERVISATTCELGLANSTNHQLLLPRFVDTSYRTALEFESWASGIGHFVPHR